ncbi:MAG: PA14 domain-containing protein [Candidatus Omnitrophota bacterium]
MESLREHLNVQGVKPLINSILHDFETVWYLIDYGRKKESLPIIVLICERIESFRKKVNKESCELKDIFNFDALEKQLNHDLRLTDLLIKVKELAVKWSEVTDKELEDIKYSRFVIILHLWVRKNIVYLKKVIKSDSQKKIETMLLSLACLVSSGIVIFIFVSWNCGLKADFYQGMNFEKYLCQGINKTINFSNYQEMNQSLPAELFSVRWQGYLLTPKSGEYTFFVTADDGFRLLIDGKPIVSDWNNHPPLEFTGTVFLSKGSHKITLEYYQWISGSVFRLSWAIDSGKRDIIAARYLRHD